MEHIIVPACPTRYGQEEFPNCGYTIPPDLYLALDIQVPTNGVVKAVALKYETDSGLTAVIQSCTDFIVYPPPEREFCFVYDGYLDKSADLPRYPYTLGTRADYPPIEPKSGVLTILPLHQVGTGGSGKFIYGSTNAFRVDYGGPAVRNAVTISYSGPNTRPNYPAILNLCGDHLIFSPGV